MSLQGNGLLINLPTGWSGRVFVPDAGDPEGDNRPTIHMASFALPADDASFGSGVISAMTSSSTFMALVEYSPDIYTPDDIATPDELLADPSNLLDPSLSGFDNGLPTLSSASFDREYVHGDSDLVNPTAYEVPFSLAGRPFQLYVVVGDQATLPAAVGTANQILQTLVVTPVVFVELQLTVAIDTFANCTGSGSGICILARADGGTSERVPATYSFTGQVTYRGICIDTYQVQGVLATTLADGRAIQVPLKIVLPGTVSNLTKALLFVEDDPVPLPAVAQLTYYGNCSEVKSIALLGTVVATLNSFSSVVGIAATAVTATSAGQVAVPLSWGGTGPGSGTLSLFQIGGAPRGPLREQSLRERSSQPRLVGRRRFNVHSAHTTVRVQLSRVARRRLRRKRRLNVEADVEVKNANGQVARSRSLLVIRPARSHSRHHS